MTMYLSDNELAKAGQDLASWVLQDDAFDQDFCYVAKEAQASPSDICNEPFMILPDDFLKTPEDDLFSNDIFMPTKMESVSPFVEKFSPMVDTYMDEEMDLHEMMKQEISQQQELDQLQFSREEEQKELKMEQDQIESQKRQHEVQTSMISVDHFSDSFNDEKVYSEDDYFLASPQEVVNTCTPYIISVPVSEVLKAKQEEETYSIVTDLNTSKPFVISLKTVTLPKQPQPTKPEIVIQSPELTLKDILENDHADEHITDFLSSSPSSSFMPSPSSSFMPSPSSYSSSPHSELSGYESAYEEKKSKPYSLTEKRLRKKEQNKRAALRYRQKKKEEEGNVHSVLQTEVERQKKLVEQYESLQVEVKFMKKLARDMLSARKRNSS